jgi:hypothetical protein
VCLFFDASKSGDMLSTGVKGMIELRSGLYLFGGFGEDIFNSGGANYTKKDIEAGLVRYAKALGKYGYGVSVRYSEPTNEWMVFVSLTRALP